MNRNDPFFDYAVSSWHFHALKATRVSEFLLDFLANSKRLWRLNKDIRGSGDFRWIPSSRSHGTPHQDSNNDREVLGIHQAARHNLASTLEFLILRGIAAETKDNQGTTPLMHAVEGNAPEAVKTLLRMPEINPNHAGTHMYRGITAVRIAASNGLIDWVRLLLNDDRIEPDCDATYLSKWLKSDFRFSRHAPSSISTPLLLNRENDIGTVRMLIDRGANINWIDAKGEVILNVAINLGNPTILDLLLANNRLTLGSCVIDLASLANLASIGPENKIYAILDRFCLPIEDERSLR